MTLIFSASADAHSYQHSSRFFEPFIRWLFPHLAPARIEFIHHLFRKCAHLTEYAMLALLVRRAIHKTCEKKTTAAETNPAADGKKFWQWDEAGLSLAIVFLYAASDELHQVFVPTRTALISDVFIDTSGGAVALLALWLFGRCRKKC